MIEEKHFIKGSIVLILIGLMMIGLILRLFQLQILEVGKYKHESSLNHIMVIPLRPLRGDILDRNGVKLAQNHIQYDLYMASIDDDEMDKSHLKSLAELSQMNAEDIERVSNILETSSGEAPVLLKTDIPLGMVIELKEKSDDFQFALIDKSSKRSYPFGTKTSHIIGYLREIDEEKLKDLKGAGYQPGDITGENGIERQYETNLRGFAGRKFMEVDNRGHWKGLLKRWEEDEDGKWLQKTALFPPTKGKDLGLTIDSDLQKLVAREIGENVGGAIIMNANSGEILAMYCYPGFDANLFIGQVTSLDWSDLMNNPDKPLQNRLIQNAYPPGSIFKVILALAGLQEGVITPHTSVKCTGVHEVGNRPFKCWKLYGHGYVDLNRAISESCDIYFYQLGEKLGADKIVEYSKLLGLGSITGIDLPGENKGLIPTAEWKKERIGERWYAGDTVNMSIGQGFLQVTPIQMVRLYAFFANGGKLINPHLNNTALTRDETPDALKNINPEYLRIIKKEGLKNTVKVGTARGCYIPDLPVGGKTGTADDPPRKTPHSWFASFAPAENPEIVMVVFGQNGGHSDELAVPISRKIYESPEMRKYITK